MPNHCGNTSTCGIGSQPDKHETSGYGLTLIGDYWKMIGTSFKDTPVRPVWRQWLCHCGGELKFSEQFAERYRTVYVHRCDKCRLTEEADESYPRVEFVECETDVENAR